MSECPTPRKVAHKTYDAALRHREWIERREGRVDKLLKPYRCGDHFHLGHKRGTGTGGLTGKIRRALRSASR